MSDAPAALGVALVIAVSAGPGTGAAAEPPHALVAAGPDDPALLADDARHARLWWWGFTGAYLAGGAVHGVIAATTDDRGKRADNLVGAASSALGVGGMLLLSPIPEVWAADDEARRTGAYGPALSRAAEAEAEGFHWLNHVACVAVAVGSGLVLWLGYDRPGPAAFTAGTNLAIGELNLWTQPSRALDRREGR